MLAIPHLSKAISMAEIVFKGAQKKSKAGICLRTSSHNKHTSFLLSKEAQAESPRESISAIEMLWEWLGIANMDFIQLGGNCRVDEMILARERSGFAGKKVWATYQL
ncbi:hypothetical protein Tco_0890877 [Tanacetum coccineum]|uniref:Uncharacterized protein n=1 Tax=Tanacetum coccineum TaxID=301880 RepID=A0ABQ5C1A9_9ASTR